MILLVLNGGIFPDKICCDMGFGSGYREIVRKLMDTSKKIEAG
jgi:hypothetical protein